MALMDKIAIIDSHVNRMKVAAELPNTATLEELTSKVEEGVGGGIGEITNGVKVSYKATSDLVPAGTFVKLNTSYSGYKVTLSRGNCDALLDMGNFIVYGMRWGSNPYSYRIYVAEISESGFVIKANYTTKNGEYTVRPYPAYLFKINDTSFVLVNKLSTSTTKDVKLYIFTYENGVLSLTTTVQPNETTLNTTDFAGSYADITAWCTTETDNDVILHCSGKENSNNSGGFLYGIKINKTDLSVSYLPNNKNLRTALCAKLIPINSTKLLGIRENSIYVITFDYNLNTYNTVTSNTLNNYGITASPTFRLGALTYLKCTNDPNSLFLIFKESSTVLKYTKITIDSSNNVTGNGVYILDQASRSTYDTINEYDDHAILNNKLVLTLSPDSSLMVYHRVRVVENINDSSLRIGPIVDINTGTTSGSILAITSNNSLVIASGYYWSSSEDYAVYINLCTMGSDLTIQQGDGSNVTVSPANGTIQGLTATDCTPSVAGEVYLLDES